MDKTSIENHNQMIKIVFANLKWVILNKYSYLIKIEISNIINEYPDYSYTLLISFMFIYLKRILSKKNFINEYNSEFKFFFKNVLLPLLILTNLEEELALDNDTVNGYCIGIDDIISENKEKRIKSTVAGLIKVFYQKNIDSNVFIVKYTLGLLEFLISGNNNNLLSNKDIFNENDIIILLFKAYSKEKIATAIFLVLNLISEVDSKNNYLNDNYIRDYFDRIFDSLSKINNVLLKHQVILFISNYSLRFYEPDSNAFETKILYLYDCLFETDYYLISNSASQEIHNFFDKKYK